MIRPHLRPFGIAALAGALAVAVTAVATAAPKPKPSSTSSTTTTAKTTTTPKKKTAKAKAKAKAKVTTTTLKKHTLKAPMGPTGKNCWQALIKDWYDGRIDKTYEVHCYRDALKHLPTDVRTYSDAYDVISRALADATRGKKHVDPTAPVAPPSGGGPGTTTTTPGPGGPSADGGPLGTGLNTGDRGATGIPIPLLVLGGLALLLVAAGGAGLLARRYQARRGGS